MVSIEPLLFAKRLPAPPSLQIVGRGGRRDSCAVVARFSGGTAGCGVNSPGRRHGRCERRGRSGAAAQAEMIRAFNDDKPVAFRDVDPRFDNGSTAGGEAFVGAEIIHDVSGSRCSAYVAYSDSRFRHQFRGARGTQMYTRRHCTNSKLYAAQDFTQNRFPPYREGYHTFADKGFTARRRAGGGDNGRSRMHHRHIQRPAGSASPWRQSLSTSARIAKNSALCGARRNGIFIERRQAGGVARLSRIAL